MRRRIPIRVKLAAALAIPLVAMGVITALEVASVAQDAARVREQTDLATATIGPNGLITALQNERNWTAAQLVGVEDQLTLEITGYEATRAEVDAALAQFEDELDRRGGTAREAYAPALATLDEIATLRTEIDDIVANTTPAMSNIDMTTDLFDRYTALIEPFFGGMSRISIAMDDPELRQGAGLMESVTRQIETIPQLINALVLPASVPTAPGDEAGLNRAPEIAEVAELQNAFRRQAEALRSATGPYAAIVEEQYPEDFTTIVDDQATQGISTGQIDVEALLAQLDVPSLDQAYLGYRDEVATELQARADHLNDSAASSQRRLALLTAVTFAAAVALTVLVSLSITRPLRSLTRQAKEMADRRLPDAVVEILDTPLGEDVSVRTMPPVRVNTRDEVADVADALSTVQDSALDLAVEQAVLRRNIADSFVNLGRRNQNLLGRQLDFITELESRETDPDTLASLFRLDHLATRMRRNAESLLVLAGIEPPRQWAAPVRLADVIRAALGEVENYQRVTVRGVEPATITGTAAADLAHLLAELVENALVFSPPDQTVDIRGVARSARLPGGYTLAIVDTGLGMPPEDIDAANRRLAGVESFTIAPSKYLGHYVAGNLAARHEIGVQLHSSPGNGITVTVELPPELLTAEAEPLPAGGDAHGDRPSRATRPAVSAGPSRTPGGLGPGPLGSGRGLDRAPLSPSDAQLASLTRAAGRVRTSDQPAMPTDPTSPVGPPRPALPTRPVGPTAAPGPARPAPAVGPFGPAPATSPFGSGPAAPAAPAVPGAWYSGQPAAPPPAGAPPGSPQSRDQAMAPPLTRRDRGAQMPATTPLTLRRVPRDEAPPAGAAATGGRHAAGEWPGGHAPTHPPRAAVEVYGFLTSFTAGVRRGLDAARPTGDGGAPA